MSTQGDDPLVSVVIPTYYRNDVLGETIESVLAQTYDPVEVIVVDDSGEANAEPVVEQWPEVRYVPLEENRGANPARTVGAEHAEGAYVHFLDDDDLLDESKLAKQVPVITRTDDVGVVYTGVREGDRVHLSNPDKRGYVLRRALGLEMWPCMTSTMLIDGALVEELLPFHDRDAAMDLEIIIQLARRTNFDYVNEPLTYKRVSPDSVGRSTAAIECRKQLLEAYADLYAAQPDWVRRRALANTYETEGSLVLQSHLWSADAVVSLAKHLYYEPREKPKAAVKLGAVLLGRPGWRLANRIGSRL
jgi:glycosyltransferase involved in cell wall biosynthesis